MSNKRIDLTQFDWMEHHSIKHMEDCGDLAIVDVNAIQMIPDLIAELKRMYEYADEITFRLMQVLKERKDLRDQLQNLLAEVDEASE